MADPSARVLAVQRLLRVEHDGAHAARLADGSAPPDVSRQAVEYVGGVTRQKRWLDFVLGAFYRGSVQNLDPELLQILRIGTYDLVVRRTAPHAAVHEAVEAAKAVLHRGAAGLANGVLRAIDRAHRAGTLPRPDSGDPADDLAVRHSHPTWAVRRWLSLWGADATRAFLEASNDAGRYALRCTAGPEGVPGLIDRLAALGVEAEPARWAPGFVEVDRLQPVLRGGLLAEGVAAVQDQAAGLVVAVLDPQPGDAVLDGAAAPGGKAVGAALAMRDRGRVVALDVSEAKARLVRQSAERQGASVVQAEAGDLATWAANRAFDRVLLDAPCSGSGVLAKRADLRWRRSPDGLAELAALQDRLLDAAARHVAPGGLLVYATCSVEPEENDDRVAAFLGPPPGVLARLRGPLRAGRAGRRARVPRAPPRPRDRRGVRRPPPLRTMTDLAAPYLDARARLAALTDGLDGALFNHKPSHGSWSAGECVVHLNKLSKGYLPRLEAAAALDAPRADGPFHYGWVGRQFIDAVRPGARPIPTANAMKPPPADGRQSAVDAARALARFEADTDRYVAAVESAAGLDLAQIKLRSPFLPVLRLPLGVWLDALGQHAVRHVMQAERAVADGRR